MPLLAHRPDFADIPRLSIGAATSIFRVFSNSINLFYPTLKETHMDSILAAPYSDQTKVDPCFDLILAIGSHLAGTASDLTHFSPESHFQRALRQIDRSRYAWLYTDQLLLLRKTLLVCIYLLLSPASGDIWRVLGFAIRLYFDLSHRPSEKDDMDEELLYMLSRTLYCLERYALDRCTSPPLLLLLTLVLHDIVRYALLMAAQAYLQSGTRFAK